MNTSAGKQSDNGSVSVFDRFATSVSALASRAGFFVFCVALVLIWAPSILLFPSIDTWQLVINTATTIITFLLVALLQNTQRRSDAAVQDKLNAIADALAAFMGELSTEYPELGRHRSELADAVGLEKREGSHQK
ncbi:low affinity iron permease family protein [Nocardia yamanashiensis]|uniref:low affinity iron permease family protein n=1 Tax=Nocardia yamanashiensis TaxID=209247 RepID=UPI001E5E8920|nr:low affinity iron permease family protein [Nocardia yamanashiensis]UGT44179.1 low affinity iron permease family protein [Nocardia yamanashiensis]